jgi:dihydroorotate dehydrogenase electron transfer subunit
MKSTAKSSSPKGDFEATVLSNQQIRTCYYRLALELEPAATAAFFSVNPGQFAMLDLTEASLPQTENIPDSLKDTAKRQLILRRPFSFSDVSIRQGPAGSVVRLEIMYCVLGPATVRMTGLSDGNKIRLLGPLGNGFQIQPQKELAILIAGGMGAPPLVHLAGVLKMRFPAMRVIIFVGAKSCESLPFTIHIGNKTGLVLEEFQQLNVVSCYVATDDGSAGFKGYITDCVEGWLAKNDWMADKTVFYACGPEGMLAAAAGLARKHGIDCQVSMERMMACGIGLCQSCAVEHKSGAEGQTEYHLCCQDGPVFDAANVVFGNERK